MGLFSSIAGYFGNKSKAKAADHAADAQVASLQQGVDAVQQQGQTGQQSINDAIAAFMPYITGGQQAVGAQGDLVGLGGAGKQASAIQALQGSPLYQSLMRTGQDTILQNSSATGGLRGGNIQRSLADFGSDTLAGVIQQQLANLGGISTQGLTAAGGSAQTSLGGAQVGADEANSLASLYSGQGSARAGGIIGKANFNAAALGNVASGLGQVASAFLPTSGIGAQVKSFI